MPLRRNGLAYAPNGKRAALGRPGCGQLPSSLSRLSRTSAGRTGTVAARRSA
jgi:hypothetical protein